MTTDNNYFVCGQNSIPLNNHFVYGQDFIPLNNFPVWFGSLSKRSLFVSTFVRNIAIVCFNAFELTL